GNAVADIDRHERPVAALPGILADRGGDPRGVEIGAVGPAWRWLRTGRGVQDALNRRVRFAVVPRRSVRAQEPRDEAPLALVAFRLAPVAEPGGERPGNLVETCAQIHGETSGVSMPGIGV